MIRKLSVATGMDWVEIPEADLRILCGCPMDSVKHLMKRGLIMATEKNGAACETGPNAILLSDVMLQNGEFANLGEFPVLQMLYKQGLILPGHPNNTGQKPLLIGLAEQVNAQLQYIYRGNYGLISAEELINAGMAPEQAQQMMRLKLRFAFGAIRPSQQLFESCIVEGQEIEIRHGVTIRRDATNVYTFRYRDQSVSVNLNLAPGQHYQSAYPLGFQKLDREYFGVIHSGEGDGWDVNRPSMSSILMFQGRIYLIDAGPNLFANLSALGIGIDEIEGLFQTHAHDDHFAGITTLMRAGHKIRYFATPPVRVTVAKKIAALLSIEEERFQDFFKVHDLTADVWNDIDGLEVRPSYSPHPLETTIFHFRTLWQDGYKSYAHLADIVSLDVLKGMITADPAKPGINQDDYDRIQDDYLAPADLKKIDIGGGMIHGVAQDFRQDHSARILLAHTARELTPQEKEIGAHAPHGTVDVLIAGQSSCSRQTAAGFLQETFPTIPAYHVQMLVNHPVIDFSPGMMLIREGQVPEQIYLILTGTVERIRSRDNHLSRLSSGAMVGELMGLYSLPVHSTYVAACFVRALAIPVPLYRELVVRNHFMARIERTTDQRSFLESTNLFAEGVSQQTLGRIIDAIQVRHIAIGEAISCRDLTMLNLIHSGRIERSVSHEVVDILQPGDFFGEDNALFDTPCLFRLKTLEPVESFQIPGELVANIPIVRWKLFAAYLNRTMKVVHAVEDGHGGLRWNQAFNIQVLEMDTHHKKLVQIANAIAAIIHVGQDRGSLEAAFERLVDYTEYHFVAEEQLMERYGYPDLEHHRDRHRQLVSQVLQYRQHLNDSGHLKQHDFNSFFTDWLVKHILSEDRRYGAFLNAQCIF
ncbi:MAG: bacteriohemerythrin [Magnetococcales bacterium]|nr:bacteriohemerythrin [Magnetococcales bacterium]